MIESEQDRRALLRDAGEPASFVGRKIFAIFNDGFQRFETAEGVVAAQTITAKCSELDVFGVRRGMPFDIRGKRYKIEGIEPDGFGMTLLVLAAAE
jgi:hypothetical protein